MEEESAAEYVDEEDEDDPDPDELVTNKEFNRKLSTRMWDENTTNLPSLMPIKEGERTASTGSASPSLGPAVRSERAIGWVVLEQHVAFIECTWRDVHCSSIH